MPEIQKEACVYCGNEKPDLKPCALCKQNHCGHHFCGEGQDSDYFGDEPSSEGFYL